MVFCVCLFPTVMHTCSASAIKLTWSPSAHHHTVHPLRSDLQSWPDRLALSTCVCVVSEEVEPFDFCTLLTRLNPCFCLSSLSPPALHSTGSRLSALSGLIPSSPFCLMKYCLPVEVPTLLLGFLCKINCQLGYVPGPVSSSGNIRRYI